MRFETKTKKTANGEEKMVALLVIAIFLAAVTIDHLLHRFSTADHRPAAVNTHPVAA